MNLYLKISKVSKNSIFTSYMLVKIELIIILLSKPVGHCKEIDFQLTKLCIFWKFPSVTWMCTWSHKCTYPSLPEPSMHTLIKYITVPTVNPTFENKCYDLHCKYSRRKTSSFYSWVRVNWSLLATLANY